MHSETVNIPASEVHTAEHLVELARPMRLAGSHDGVQQNDVGGCMFAALLKHRRVRIRRTEKGAIKDLKPCRMILRPECQSAFKSRRN